MRAILLDALGTLIELEPPAPHLRRELAVRFDVRLTEEQAERAIATEIAYYRAHLGEGRDADSLAELRRRCAETLRSALPDSELATTIGNTALLEALLASLRFVAYDDAEPALRAARASGLHLVVVSNWDISLHDVVERLGLAPLLDAVVTSAEVDSPKPNPAIFRRALELAGAAPEDAVHVGDSVEEDVAGARAAGIEPILLLRDPATAGPAGVRTVGSLLELGEIAP